MEDLAPLLIFIVIAVINVIKYLAEKGGKKPSKEPAGKPSQPHRTEPSSLDEFFDGLAQKLAPQPRKLPDWPEERKRPDYIHEMEEYEVAIASPSPEAQTKTSAPEIPKVKQPSIKVSPIKREAPRSKISSFRIKAQNPTMAGVSGSQIPVPPLLQSNAGQTQFQLKTRKQLKQALIASMVFGAPRAYDHSFHNTMAK